MLLFPSIVLLLMEQLLYGGIMLTISILLIVSAVYIWWHKDDPPKTVGNVYTTYPQTGNQQYRGAEMPSRYAYLEQQPKYPPGQAPPPY